MINLEKKKPLNLNKEVPGLNKVKIGLSWDARNDGQNADADSSIFMLNEDGKIPSDTFMVFYNNLQSLDSSVIHSGDNKTGIGEGDDEVISINLSSVSTEIVQIMIVITIHNKNEGFHFGNVLNSSVKVYNQANNNIICQYKLSETFDGYDSLVIGRFYRNGNEWEFEVIGQAYEGGLAVAYQLYS